MANKKRGGRNNKKKARGQSAQQQQQRPAGTNNNSINQNTNSKKNPLRSISNIPTFHNKETSGTLNDVAGGYYEIYKRATTRFWDWMKETLPHRKMTSVNDLQRGANEILEQNIAQLDTQDHTTPPNLIVAPSAIIKDLSTSIQYREILTTTKYGQPDGGDQGHKYIVDVLKHCRYTLKSGRRVAKVAIVDFEIENSNNNKNEEEQVTTDDEKMNEIGGRFNALLLEDDYKEEQEEEEEEEEDVEAVENDIRERKFPSFKAPENLQEDIDIEQGLINGTDRFQAIALLHTMNDMMGVVDQHYGLLKNHMRGQGIDGEDQTSVIKALLECSAVANMATESIQVAENALKAAHSHMSSFYHVLALVFLPNIVADLETTISDASKKKLEQNPHMALDFVADIVQCSFHNRGDDKIAGKVKRFVKRSGLRLDVVEQKAEMIHFATTLETMLTIEESLSGERIRLAVSSGLSPPHSWLKQDYYIGGDRCILNTQNIVQKLMDVLNENKKLVGKPGFWGVSFDEMNNPPRRIRGDLDEAFGGTILPELVEICRQAPFHLLPERSQLITLLDLLMQHVKQGDRTRPVSIALTFGLHAMLTSIFVLQGSGDLARIASYSKASYKKLFTQLDEICDQSKQPQNAPNFYLNVALFKNLVNFAQPVSADYNNFHVPFLDPSVAEQLAFWNPLVGGEYMLYAIYICSIGLGSATVDSLGQLRFTLHLYHAMKQCFPGLDIPFLETLDKAFANSKAVWVSGRPQRGSFTKHFWIAWGMSVSEASRIVASSSFDDNKAFQDFLKAKKPGSTGLRDLDEIVPEQYSASYRRLVLRDFADDSGVEEFTVRNATEEAKEHYSSLFDLMVRVNLMRDSMDDDENFILQTNFSALGCILLEFTNALSEHLGWDAMIDQLLVSSAETMRTGKTMGGRKIKPGSFTASDINLKRQGIAHFWAALLSRLDKGESSGIDSVVKSTETFMKQFFGGLSSESYTFFVESTPAISRSRNPLEGSYPYGRTGRTSADPLQGFLHFKYNKAGEPSVRVIKPGKYTPYHPSDDGAAATPYKERGSQMKRLPNGRYRHIASYTLDELTQMGWDGAMYTSTRGRHEAVGHYVPFIVGYDSDEADEYDRIDVRAGKRAGVIGLQAEENGLYMRLPDMNGGSNLGQIRNAK